MMPRKNEIREVFDNRKEFLLKVVQKVKERIYEGELGMDKGELGTDESL